MNIKINFEPLTPTLSRKGRGSQSELSPSPLAGEGWGEGFGHRNYAPYFKEFARSLRKNQTDAEKKIWFFINNNQLNHKFRRQFVVDNKYIADFICLEKRLIIELDGGQHCENARDFERTLYLKDQNFRVTRFWNNEILQNIEGCVEMLVSEINKSFKI